MAYTKQTWVNRQSQINATRMNHIEDGIKNAYCVPLIAVSDTAPSECSTGDKYFNTTSKKVFTATGTNTWGSTGETPNSDIIYIDFNEKLPYTYDGDTLVLLVKLYDIPIYPSPTITAKASGDSTTLTIATAGGSTIIPIALRNGTNYTDFFEVDTTNNRVKVKSSRVKKVLVSAQMTIGRGPSDYVSLILNKNGTAIGWGRYQFTNWNACTFQIVPVLIDVSQNDYFDIYIGSPSTGDYVLNNGQTSTYITIEAVEVE